MITYARVGNENDDDGQRQPPPHTVNNIKTGRTEARDELRLKPSVSFFFFFFLY
jgi:hypothetical protein